MVMYSLTSWLSGLRHISIQHAALTCWQTRSRPAQPSLHRRCISSLGFYDSTVEKYAQQPVEILSLSQMMDFGRSAWNDPDKILKSARYVQRELPKRLARRLLDLQLLPYIVVTNPHIKAVYDGYQRSFETLRTLPPVLTLEDNVRFTNMLRDQLDQHASMLDMLATGLRECKSKELVGPCLQLDAFFDSMLRSRISRRVIAEQHLHLNVRRPGYVGVICTDLDVADAIEFAAQKTQQVCIETYGVAPEFSVTGDSGATLPYIPAHLDYMLYELLKNAARAVVEFHAILHGQGRADSRRKLPPVNVRICAGVSSLTIRVADQGGGVPPHLLNKVWSYGFTTVGQPPHHGARDLTPPPYASIPTASSPQSSPSASTGNVTPAELAASPQPELPSPAYTPSTLTTAHGATACATDQLQHTPQPSTQGTTAIPSRSSSPNAPAAEPTDLMMELMNEGLGQNGGLPLGGSSRFRMAGLGFGLPLSRLYARYFGGDLTLTVIPGYGTDAYLTLTRLEEREWREQVDEVI